MARSFWAEHLITVILLFFHYRWFDGFNWEGLRLRNLQPPITPKIQGSLDTSNFDDYPMDADGPPPGNILCMT